ncbi:splicing factor 3A subunit 2-like [Pongo abelii]|uniref:splicing factor 3A subunit 2-like n=1 Tax=Pongo abelii TaxID=9601 RepID=UPI0023E8B30E|nr:splicing factor 3A subunit 2-like [Pongo abelii]
MPLSGDRTPWRSLIPPSKICSSLANSTQDRGFLAEEQRAEGLMTDVLAACESVVCLHPTSHPATSVKLSWIAAFPLAWEGVSEKQDSRKEDKAPNLKTQLEKPEKAPEQLTLGATYWRRPPPPPHWLCYPQWLCSFPLLLTHQGGNRDCHIREAPPVRPPGPHHHTVTRAHRAHNQVFPAPTAPGAASLLGPPGARRSRWPSAPAAGPPAAHVHSPPAAASRAHAGGANEPTDLQGGMKPVVGRGRCGHTALALRPPRQALWSHKPHLRLSNAGPAAPSPALVPPPASSVPAPPLDHDLGSSSLTLHASHLRVVPCSAGPTLAPSLPGFVKPQISSPPPPHLFTASAC